MIRVLVPIFLLLLPIAPAAAAELTVYAAASLSDALAEIAPRFTQATGHTVKFSLGASGTLARQIQEGARADVFVSADELRMNQLDQAGLLLAGTRRTLLANTLVVVIAADRGARVAALPDLAQAGIRRLAIGEPATVPAGTYAKQLLEKAGLWTPLAAKIVPLENVRAVLSVVESGNADAGFVYRTDALLSPRVRIAVEIPAAEGPAIRYPLAVLRESRNPEASRRFATFLAGPEAMEVFKRFGFLAVPAGPPAAAK